MTRTHARSGIFATGLAALLSAALIAAIPGYAAESAAETPTTVSQQNAAKELAKNLSEAYSRVRTVQNGDVVTLIDPNHSPDVGTSTRSRRRMAPASQYQASTRRPSPASEAKVDTPFAGRSAQRQPSKQTYYAKPRAPHNPTATVPAAPPSSHTAVFHRTYPPHSQTIQKPTSCTQCSTRTLVKTMRSLSITAE